MKIVINKDFGAFCLSKAALEYLCEHYKEKVACKNINSLYFHNRTAPELIECVETLGKKANGRFASLTIIEIPDNIDWSIDENVGKERVCEKHRIWDENGERWSDEC